MIKVLFLSLPLLVFFGSRTHGQAASRDMYWLSGGLGKSHLPSLMIAMGYEPKSRPTVLVARYSVNAEILQAVEPGLKVSEIGLLYGLRTGKFRLAAGLSRVWGNDRGKYLYTEPDPLWGSGEHYEFVKYGTIGIPAEIRFYTTLRCVGLGVTGFGNLNAKRSFAGLNLSVYIGRFEPRKSL
ncbi:hypothetical protein [Fibrisoma limi]|nr:hypothetical protein [Fibrisoma limi]